MEIKKILLLAGTTEGRAIAKALSQTDVQVVISVATEYGEDLIQRADNVQIMSGRLDKDEMKSLIEKEKVELVIDATHPYAVVVTQNIREACEETKTEYLRLVRPEIKEQGLCTFKSLEETINFLNQVEGSVLLTTGSKDLLAFTGVVNYEERLYPRVLPMVETLQSALSMGYKRSHMICMQGPFSYELNVAMLKHLQVSYMVTKDSGDIGGLQEKLEAAREVGVTVLLIERPQVEKGYTLEEILQRIDSI